MTLLFAFLTSRLGRFVGAFLIIVAFGIGLYFKGYWNGSSARDAHWKSVVAAEKTRQLEENQAAKQEERRVIARLNARNSELENKLDDLEREAADDPDADKPALNRGSVRRIDGVH